MKVTKTNQNGIDLIKSFEGFKSKPYKCPAGIPTIGYGATFYPNGTKVTMKDAPITEARATQMLQSMLKKFEQYVDSYTTDEVNENQFSALVSFCYNLGPSALKSSTLLRKVNADVDDESIEHEFGKWVKADGKTLSGLVRRRQAEAQLYFS